MTYTPEQVVAIVLEVIRRLEGQVGAFSARPCACAASAHRAATTTASVQEQGGAGPTAAATGPREELVLAERVISQRLVAGRLEGVQRVVVAPRAVVTPLVRDELRRRGIELVRRGA